MIYLKTLEEIDIIARGGTIIAELLAEIQEHIVPGVSTMELNVFADDYPSYNQTVQSFNTPLEINFKNLFILHPV